MMNLLIVCGVGLLLTMTLLPLSPSGVWWVRILDFPRLQLFVVSIALVVLELIYVDLFSLPGAAMMGVTLGCALYQLSWILPYTALATNEVAWTQKESPGARIKILCANVLTPNRNAKGLLGLIRQNAPDIVITLESDLWWQQQLSELETEYCHTLKCPLDNLYGMHLYSRLPLHNPVISYLIDEEIPSMHCEIELGNGTHVRCHFLHPSPPVPTHNTDSGQRDAELVVVARSVVETQMPVIVAGDLNDVAWSETTRLFRKISGLLDPRVGRGLINTFHADYWPFRWPLDHLFHSNHFTVAQLKRLPKFGSDHFALFSELVLEPEAENANGEGLAATASDEAIAEEKLDSQDASVDDVPGEKTQLSS